MNDGDAGGMDLDGIHAFTQRLSEMESAQQKPLHVFSP